MFTVYTKPGCTFCDQATGLLKSQGKVYRTINVDVGQPKVEGEQYVGREEFLNEFAVRTLPLILRDDMKIGGFSELKKFLNESHAAA